MGLAQLFDNVLHMPTIPKVVQEVLQMLNRDDADMNQIIERLKVDQVVSAKILRLANTAHYGMPGKVASINDAVSLLGTTVLRNLVASCGVTSAFKQMDGFDLNTFWHDSLFAASCAKWVAQHARINADNAFTAGLMHGIGKLLIHMAYPKESESVAKADQGKPYIRMKLEHSLIQTDHCEAGAKLAELWHFPKEIQDAIRHYVEPLKVEPFPKYAGCVHLGLLAADWIKNATPIADIEAVFPHAFEGKLEIYMGKLFTDMDKLAAINAQLDEFI